MLNEIATDLYRRLTQNELVGQIISPVSDTQKSAIPSLASITNVENFSSLSEDDPDWMVSPPFVFYGLE